MTIVHHRPVAGGPVVLALPLILLTAVSAQRAPAAALWLAGVDPHVWQTMASGQPTDYMALFRSNAAWKQAAEHVAVFKVSTQWLLYGSDANLKRMVANLRARNIALGVEALMIPHMANCGQGIEGYSARGTIALIAQRIKQLGGSLDYIAMDEPLNWGHAYVGEQACQSSIFEVAQQVAENVAAAKEVFPNVQIGDIEPIGSSPEDWVNKIEQFASAFAAATGDSLAFIHADIQWSSNYLPALKHLTQWAHSNGIKVGYIYNALDAGRTNVAWVNDALARARTIEANAAMRPDHAVLQTWTTLPDKWLPETTSGTMTNFVDQYVAQAAGTAKIGRWR